MEPPSNCIGQYEDSARKVRVERSRRVVTIEYRRLAIKEIGVGCAERLPILRGTVALHPFVNEQQIGPGDRLMVQTRDAVMACEALQRRREALDRFEQWMLTQIDPGHAHMV